MNANDTQLVLFVEIMVKIQRNVVLNIALIVTWCLSFFVVWRRWRTRLSSVQSSRTWPQPVWRLCRCESQQWCQSSRGRWPFSWGGSRPHRVSLVGAFFFFFHSFWSGPWASSWTPWRTSSWSCRQTATPAAHCSCQGAGQGRSPVGEGPPLLQLFHLSSPQLWENVINFLCHDWPIQFGLKYRAWMLAFPLDFKWVRVTHFSSLLQFFISFRYR